jgi:predicted DNA-binding ribbon-helix-helix protein
MDTFDSSAATRQKETQAKRSAAHMVRVLLAGQEPLSGSDEALITRYVRIGRRPTSFRLEAATWNRLCAIAHRQNLTVDEVCGDIAEVTAEDADLAAAIRLFVLGDIICEQTPIDLLPAKLRELIENPLTLQ